MSSVPDTTTFSLADVVAAVLPSSDDLDECFDDAVDGAFDSSYGPGDESNLLQFRNYGQDVAAQNPLNIELNFTRTGACAGTRDIPVWKNRNPNSVSNGDKFWEDDNGSPGDPYPGNGNNFYGAFTGLNSSSFRLSSLGIVSDVETCNTANTLTDVFYEDEGGNTTTPVDYYYDGTIGDASNLEVADIIYTDITLQTPLQTSPAPATFYQQIGSAATTTKCPLRDNGGNATKATFTINNSGIITVKIPCLSILV